MPWFDSFIEQIKEFDKQLFNLRKLCDQYGLDYEQKKKDAEYLAQSHIISNVEALEYVINRTRKDEWYKTTILSYDNIKGEYNMFDVNKIKSGDYVESCIGEIGYVTEIKPDENTLFNWNLTDGTKMYTGSLCSLKEYFKQIGTYKFDEEEKKDKIGKLNYMPITMDNGLMYTKDKIMIDKINEIIDYLKEE